MTKLFSSRRTRQGRRQTAVCRRQQNQEDSIVKSVAVCYLSSAVFLGDYQFLRYTAVERSLHLVMISHQFLTHLARDRSGAKEQRKGRDALRLISVEKMQGMLRNRLIEDRIKSLAEGTKYQGVAKKLKAVLMPS